MKIKNYFINTILILVILTGVSILLYPTVSNWVNTEQHKQRISAYQSDIDLMPEGFVEEELQKAEDYNNSLIGRPVKDPFLPGSGMALPDNYLGVLDLDGVIGYIDIPCINIHLPIFHGTSEGVLKKGVGHIEGTAFPIGGEGLNPILSAHTGLPSAKIFTDLIDVKIDDVFTVSVLNKTLYYKVNDIRVILPDETQNLVAVAGKDYVTLLTCTPYGVNSHRLVVQGERSYDIAMSLVLKKESTLIWQILLVFFSVLGMIFFTMILVLSLIIRKEKLHNRRNVLLVLGLLSLIAAGFSAYHLFGIYEINGRDDMNPDERILSETEKQEWQTKQAKPQEVFIQVKTKIKVLNGSQAYLRLINPPYSHYRYRVQLVLTNQHRLLYQNEIDPGSIIEFAELNEALVQEENEAVVIYEFLDSRGKSAGTYQVDVTLSPSCDDGIF